MAPRLPHPSHKHRLIHKQASDTLNSEKIDPSSIPPCVLCHRNISADYYVCYKCNYYCHGACVEALPQVDRHPLHPDHPLILVHCRPPFICDACDELFDSDGSSFCCDYCNFDLDICCALSTLSDRGGSLGGTIPEQVAFPFHPHPLTSFSTRHDFVNGGNCMICRGSVEGDGDGYMCLHRRCEFLIHKRCIQDLYYVGGSEAPRVYHDHPLETFVGGEDKGSIRCVTCRSDDASGDFIGCSSCQVFYHRDCIQASDMIQYPPHPDHTMILFINGQDNNKPQCQSCSSYVEVELCYRCTSCEYSVHVGCALKVLSYCEEGMTVEINSSIHPHQLILCHRTETIPDRCMNCWDQLTGAAYVCQEQDCAYQIHGRCAESESEVNHPYHPEHLLSYVYEADEFPRCQACLTTIVGFSYSCDLCVFHLHEKCAARMPTRKHYLHEHELVYFDKIPKLKCNRCDTPTYLPLFRCVPCNFNLHEKCMELPAVVKHDTHFHPLTLREFFMEDDTGEYYCDLCEKRRDGRLGVYVCGRCELTMDRPWAFHIECILPELRKVYENVDKSSVIDAIANEISWREEKFRKEEEKIDKMRQKLEGLRKKQAALTLEYPI